MAMLRALFLCSLFALAACAHRPEADAARAPVVLIAIDGFRADYLDRGVSPTMTRLAAEGARATMRPSFPSNTFPNHYALITGLVPDHNGIVNNRMEAPERPGLVFTMGNREVAADPFWWQGVPLWVSAERQGVKTGTMFWPGSDYELHGLRPSQWRAFDQAMPGEARVDTLLSWLDLPEAERPRFFTLYFDIVDTAGHRYGPDAPETNAAITQVDTQIARLLEGLDARGLAGKVNLVIVADHGMTAVSADRTISLDALMAPDAYRVIWDGPFVGIVPNADRERDVEAALLGRRDHMECWRKGEMPARFRYGSHPRVPAIICLAERGWNIRSSQFPPYAGTTLGSHGYDPVDPHMAAVFIANGPAIKPNTRLADFDNVSVYPLLARLVGVTPEANDGDPAATAPALR